MATYYRWRQSTVTYQATHVGTSSSFTDTGASWNYSTKPPTVEHSNIIGYYFKWDDDALYFTIDYENKSHGISSGYYFGSSNAVYYKALNSVTVRYTSGMEASINGQAAKYEIGRGPGTQQGYVYSTNASAYPNGGVSGNYYYDQRTTVESPTIPKDVTVPSPITSSTFTVSWTAATSNTNYPVKQYLVQVKMNNATSSPILAQKTVTGTSTEITIPTTYDGAPVTSVNVIVLAQDTNNQDGPGSQISSVPVYLAPTLTVPALGMQGQPITVNWSIIEGASSYTLQRKSSADTDWVQVYSGANTTFSETVGTWTTVQYRVQAVFSGTPGGWAESASIPVVSASSLVISGTDEDLGVVTNDIPYSISTDTGNQITATITVNNAVIFSGNVGNSTADVIPVLDLITGEGTIVISATVEASGSPVTATRTWTYEKAAITFPNSGSVAQVTKEGENIYPKVLAEGVRLPGGKTLDQVMGFPCQIYTGSYVGTGTSGASNPNTLTFPFEPKVVFISGQSNAGNADYSTWTPMIRGVRYVTTYNKGTNTYQMNVSWSNNSVSYYASSGSNFTDIQLNNRNTTYYYVAIG